MLVNSERIAEYLHNCAVPKPHLWAVVRYRYHTYDL